VFLNEYAKTLLDCRASAAILNYALMSRRPVA
jgi:hypothetical protein